MSDDRILVKPLSSFLLWLNKLLKPLMILVGGNSKESPQETHPYSSMPWLRTSVARNLCVKSTSAELPPAMFSNKNPCTHMPILNKIFNAQVAWTHYMVLSVEGRMSTDVWFVGWLSPDNCQVSRLPLADNEMVRVLMANQGKPVYFFGVNRYGDQIPLSLVDTGELGDGKFSTIRLF